jgi:hypothetical protein
MYSIIKTNYCIEAEFLNVIGKKVARSFPPCYSQSPSNKHHKFVDLIFFHRNADLGQMWQFVDMRFADHIFLEICKFAICRLNNFLWT